MARIPLLSDQDLEADLPSYEDTQERPAGADGAETSFFSSKRVEFEDSVAAAHVSIRLAFLRKVFGILAFQFGATFAFCLVIYLTPGVRGFIQNQSWILLLTMFGSIGVLMAMFVHARNVPYNYFLLGAWTVLQALTVGAIVSFYEVEVVIQALLLTSVVVGGLFTYTLQSKRDFQKHYALVYTVSCVFLVAILLQVLIMSPIMDFVMSVAGALLFSVYLIIDVDMIMNHFSEEDYIIACCTIYMDIIGLFLRLLEILDAINRN
uniref:Inhibitor of apoptosis-promoting Bax1-domain-containing protein n=1 Tax=Panagrellus redivivus TaxID=6233 RepID=A0A7E4UM84_PANRE